MCVCSCMNAVNLPRLQAEPRSPFGSLLIPGAPRTDPQSICGKDDQVPKKALPDPPTPWHCYYILFVLRDRIGLEKIT